MLESMKNLANNGRVSHLAAKFAGILGVRAIGKASVEGTLEMLSKVNLNEELHSDNIERYVLNFILFFFCNKWQK